jgi:hypothetical protein
MSVIDQAELLLNSGFAQKLSLLSTTSETEELGILIHHHRAVSAPMTNQGSIARRQVYEDASASGAVIASEIAAQDPMTDA